MDTVPLNHKPAGSRIDQLPGPRGETPRTVLSDKGFAAMLCLERKRAERSKRHFVLMLLDGNRALRSNDRNSVLRSMAAAVSSSTRNTDILGWYDGDAVLGVILTELGQSDIHSALNTVHSKVNAALRSECTLRMANDIHVSFHLYPEELGLQDQNWAADSKLYPDLSSLDEGGRFSRAVKRSMDVAGSLMAIILFSPVFALIAAAIKLTSKGPALFRQERVGQYGIPFTFLKFRSMHFRAGPEIHEAYVKQFIMGRVPSADRAEPFKLRNDPRITPLGKVLRKTSLDELPQLLNVLKGEMSLVGPRPPVPYEVEVYDRWHRRRVLEAKPGITGLWQISGRSKTEFDDMVRLDLQYAVARSLWLDVKILAKTPWAVLSGEGAY
ncbi:MAG TPA: sugar transferase [Terriglobia bacterium]|jgi:lipopolysaccharide/colanic/teichoic acid biosynthesis glycosyltransferase|nr:sugar transferase [Terriglobia bacterium]